MSSIAEQLREVQNAFVDLYSVTEITRDEQYAKAGRAATAIDQLSAIIPTIESIERKLKVAQKHAKQSGELAVALSEELREAESIEARHGVDVKRCTICGATPCPYRQPQPSQHTITEEAVAYLLAQMKQVVGPLQTVMWEAPDGQGGQFADKKVALLCWLNRALQAHLIRKEPSDA